MASRLLGEEAIASLVTQAPENCASSLSHAGLQPLLADLQSGRYLEQTIIATQLEDIRILMRAAGEGRIFLQYWTLRFEITNLKAIIRGRMHHADNQEIRRQLSDLGFLARLPLDTLLATEDVGELLRRLETTPYGDMVRFARRAFEAQPDLFDLDAALDRRFYHGLIELALPLESSLGKPFKELMAAYIDRVNLNWLLRFRFAYGLPAAQVYYLLIPTHYRLGSNTMKVLATLGRMDEVLAALPAPYRDWLHGAADINQAAAMLERQFARSAHRILHSAAPAFARAFAYLLLRDRELRRVRAVLKGRALGIDTDTIALAAGLAVSPVAKAVA